VPDPIDPKVIDSIVAEVLGQIRRRIGSARSPETNGSAVELADRVVTADLLKQKVPDGGAIRISSKTILTPSARDEIKARRIKLNQDQSTSIANPSKMKGVIVAAHLPVVVQNVLNDVKKHASAAWRVEMESGSAKVVERIRSTICRGESPQVVAFVKTPHEVACLVNRTSECRAAVVRSAADVQRIRSEMAANVICVDLAEPTFIGLRRILKAGEDTLDQIGTREAKQ
jgi:hypothetical protein